MQFDLTKPNTGRIVDYWMGGSHNFEIDRQLADQVVQQFPVIADLARHQRALVKRFVEFYYARGIRAIVDFGSSLPTCDNTHLIAHALDPQIKVVYSDIDPITIAYGQDLLRGNPNAIYLSCDAAEPRGVLESPETRALLGAERRVGIIFLGLAPMLSDEQVRSAWQTLYEWAAPGSYLGVSIQSEHWSSEPDLLAVRNSYGRSNILAYPRTLAQIRELIPPWHLTEEGIQPNANWGAPPPAEPPRIVGYSMMLSRE